MSRTDLNPATLARSLRRMAGDGSIEWVMEPIQASVLHDIADMLDENDKLRELVRDMMRFFEDGDWCDKCNHARECDSQEQYEGDCLMRLVFRDRMRELGVGE